MPSRAVFLLLCTSVLAGCSDEPHVIGRFVDTSCADQAGALFCSGFELPDLSEWDERIVVNAGQVSQSEELRRSGRGALHASSTAASSTGAVSVEFPRVDAGELFLRTYIYVPADVDTMTPNVMFLGDVPAPDPFKGVDFNFEGGAPEIFVPENDPNRFTSSLLVIPRDEWFCYQVRILLSEDEGSVTIRVNGELGLDATGIDTLPPGGMHLLRAGVDWSSKQETRFALYLDDLVLSTSEIGCE